MRAPTYLSSRTHFGKRSRPRLALLRARQGVRRMRKFARTQPQTVVGGILVMAGVLTTVYLMNRDAESWNATLKVRLPMRAPVGRVGRSETSAQISTLSDVSKYT